MRFGLPTTSWLATTMMANNTTAVAIAVTITLIMRLRFFNDDDSPVQTTMLNYRQQLLPSPKDAVLDRARWLHGYSSGPHP
ncbi:hypothetical protein OAG52_03305 [Verrucomicrobia bacterium]|nr:hypothetical protein [Verrucomicrobiota bacterium]